MSELEEHEGPVKLGPFKLDREHERKLMLVGVGVSVLGLILIMLKRKQDVAAVSPAGITSSLPPGATSSRGPTPEELLAQQLAVEGLRIGHSAGYALSFTSGAVSHDVGSHATSGGGSGGISFLGISLGGGGHKEGSDSWDLLTSESLNAGLGGSNLSESEFDLLVQQGQALTNSALRAQQSAYDAAAAKLDRYKAKITPATNPPRPPPVGHFGLGA